MAWNRPHFCVLALLIGVAPACGQTQGKATTGPEKMHVLDVSACDESEHQVAALDLNNDGKPDVWKLSSGSTLTCKIIDLNYDGRRDFYRHFSGGQLTLERADLDFDGRLDMSRVYQAGSLIREELDTNYDGKPDIWKYYQASVVARIERDSNGNGRVDYWEKYQGGKLAAVAYDGAGDGKPDKWEAVNQDGTAEAATPETAPEAEPQPATSDQEVAPTGSSTTDQPS